MGVTNIFSRRAGLALSRTSTTRRHCRNTATIAARLRPFATSQTPARMLSSRALARTCTGPLSRRWTSSTLQRRHDAVRTACANSPQMAGTVHLSEKLLIDEHVDMLCTLLRSGESPVGTRRIFLERNNIGDTGAKLCQKTSCTAIGQPAGRLRSKARLRASLNPPQSPAALSALAGHTLLGTPAVYCLVYLRCQAAR